MAHSFHNSLAQTDYIAASEDRVGRQKILILECLEGETALMTTILIQSLTHPPIHLLTVHLIPFICQALD